jgi:membrane protease YdiL (CAAX protease family)
LLAIALIISGNLLIAPLSAVLILLWAWRSGTPWQAIGMVRPKSWVRATVIGVVFGAAFKLVMKSVVMPLLGAPPINQAYHFLAGNTLASLGMLYPIIVGAGFGEELLFRGYMFERLRSLLGRRVWVEVVAVLFTSALFGMVHYPVQGIPGVQQATIFGILFASLYSMGAGLPLLMIAHASFDLVALAIIHWDLETSVAHWFFR